MRKGWVKEKLMDACFKEKAGVFCRDLNMRGE